MGDEVGGYQRDHATTFGVGTIKPCNHPWESRVVIDEIDLMRRRRGWFNAKAIQPGDQAGTVRCLGCGNKVEA